MSNMSYFNLVLFSHLSCIYASMLACVYIHACMCIHMYMSVFVKHFGAKPVLLIKCYIN